MLGMASSLLGCCQYPVGGRVFSLVVGVEALRVGFYQALLPLSACPALKELVVEASEASVVTVNLCATCVGVYGSKVPR